MEKTIEIPFGAKDSELKGWEYTIPEGMEAEIKDGKVIVREKESEDERIRSLLVWQVHRNIEDETNDLAKSVYDGIKGHDPDLEESIEDWKKCLAYLERQKEQKPFPAEDEKDFLEKEVKAFLCNYDKEFDDDAPTYDIAEHFYQLGKNSQKPAEWSETDKLHLNNAILEAKKEWGVNSYTARWLESLRDNYKKCNSHWKPSEEQMDALHYVKQFDYGGYRGELESLYYDLKKLI